MTLEPKNYYIAVLETLCHSQLTEYSVKSLREQTCARTLLSETSSLVTDSARLQNCTYVCIFFSQSHYPINPTVFSYSSNLHTSDLYFLYTYLYKTIKLKQFITIKGQLYLCTVVHRVIKLNCWLTVYSVEITPYFRLLKICYSIHNNVKNI